MGREKTRACKCLFKYLNPPTTLPTSRKTISHVKMSNVVHQECGVGGFRSSTCMLDSGHMKPNEVSCHNWPIIGKKLVHVHVYWKEVLKTMLTAGFLLSASSRLKMATWRFEPFTFWGNKVKWETESLILPTTLSYQATLMRTLLQAPLLHLSPGPTRFLCKFSQFAFLTILKPGTGDLKKQHWSIWIPKKPPVVKSS